MKNRVYWNMLMLAIVSVTITTISLAAIFYNVFHRQMETEVRNQALLLERSLNYASNDSAYLHTLALTRHDVRVSIVKADGGVVFDSFQDVQSIGSHFDRPEIQDAVRTGFGQSTRYSSTLGEKTFYYAVKLDHGAILRVAKTTNSVVDIFVNVCLVILMAMMLSVLLCNLLAIRLTRKIIAPINNLDLTKDDQDIYEELTPFICTIHKQRQYIKEQFLILEERAGTIKTITENMKEGILIFDKSGCILLANNSVQDVFHITEERSIGKNILEVIRNIDLQNGIKQSLAGMGSDLTFQFEGKTLQVFLSPVTDQDGIKGTIALFLDITAKASAEKMRKEFSANVSHELKTPLTTISGYAEMINNGMVKAADIKNFSGKIYDEAARLLALIENIIKVSALDEGIHVEQRTEFDIKLVAFDAVEQLHPFADEKQIGLVVTGSNAIVYANRQMMFELFYNLIENGIKYNQPGGNVDIVLSEAGAQVKVEVTDTGIGIDHAHLERIFERFYRVDRSRSKKTGGTGLGLAIVKHIVEYHGGTIDIESSPGAGTKLIIVLGAMSLVSK